MVEPGTTAICEYDATRILVRDRDLCADLIGNVSLGDFVHLLVMGVPPSEAQRAVVEAAIVALAEHGLTPSALAARLTFMGAPESFQGAVAAGILGVGDQFVGTVELVAPILSQLVEAGDGAREQAAAIVARHRETKSLVPGFGQPHHKPDDPRPRALFAVGERHGVDGRYVAALKLLGEEVDKAAGRHITINAPAAIAALFLGISMPIPVMRGFVVIARCIGMVAHLREEQISPVAKTIWNAGAHAVPYSGAPLP